MIGHEAEGESKMRNNPKRWLKALIVLLSCTILGGANRCADCGEGTYYSETSRKCLPKLGQGVQVDSSSGMIVSQLSDEAVASLQVAVAELQNRIETLESTTTNHADDIAANTDAVLSLPDFSGWDTSAADDFDGNYTSLANLPSLPSASVNDLGNYLTVDTGSHSVVLSGANLKVLDGTGSTDCSGSCNGLGNILVGYDEGSAGNKSGSHNLVVGSGHTYLSYGGFVAGRNNGLEEAYCSVSGGQGNVASAPYASISGGVDNTATGDSASVSGGRLNSAVSDYSWIGGGESNQVNAQYGSIVGGDNNLVGQNGRYGVVSGGKLNTVTASWATTGGGSYNTASGEGATVSGGTYGEASGVLSAVTGDYGQHANDQFEVKP